MYRIKTASSFVEIHSQQRRDIVFILFMKRERDINTAPSTRRVDSLFNNDIIKNVTPQRKGFFFIIIILFSRFAIYLCYFVNNIQYIL